MEEVEYKTLLVLFQTDVSVAFTMVGRAWPVLNGSASDLLFQIVLLLCDYKKCFFWFNSCIAYKQNASIIIYKCNKLSEDYKFFWCLGENISKHNDLHNVQVEQERW